MSDALDPSDFMDAARIFLPSSDQIVDRIFIESISGDLYSLTSIIGSDLEIGDDFFVIVRSACSENELPSSGAWRDVDQRHTKLRAEYRYRRGEGYKDFQELYDVKLRSRDEVIIISRKPDDFGVEKLMVEIKESRGHDA